MVLGGSAGASPTQSEGRKYNLDQLPVDYWGTHTIHSCFCTEEEGGYTQTSKLCAERPFKLGTGDSASH